MEIDSPLPFPQHVILFCWFFFSIQQFVLLCTLILRTAGVIAVQCFRVIVLIIKYFILVQFVQL